MNVDIVVQSDASSAGRQAAAAGAHALRQALQAHAQVNIVVATGNSQLDMLEALVREADIDWKRVVGFHLDEYIGISDQHPASFRRYLREHFVERVALGAFHYVGGDGDPAEECRRLGELIRQHPTHVAFIGIGENGHLAFNDPPADMETRQPYILVELDEACRRQQVGEGWFGSLDEVPKRAISMSIQQILSAQQIICTVPDERKAKAVQGAVKGPVTAHLPASALQRHPHTTLFLDSGSASLL
jgi:glucosamine-6-phosphate deaminase